MHSGAGGAAVARRGDAGGGPEAAEGEEVLRGADGGVPDVAAEAVRVEDRAEPVGAAAAGYVVGNRRRGPPPRLCFCRRRARGGVPGKIWKERHGDRLPRRGRRARRDEQLRGLRRRGARRDGGRQGEWDRHVVDEGGGRIPAAGEGGAVRGALRRREAGDVQGRERGGGGAAGVRAGMVVDKVNGIDTSSTKEVGEYLQPGKEVRFGVRCDDARLVTFKAVSEAEVAYGIESEDGAWPKVLVTGVQQGSDAEENGLAADMVVMGMNSKPVVGDRAGIDAVKAATQTHETTLLCLNPVGEHAAAGRLSKKGLKLNVFMRVVKARALVKADFMLLGSSDPYVVIAAVDADGTPLVGRRAKPGLPARTPMVKNNVNPTFNFSLPSEVLLHGGEKLVLEVYDDDLVGADDFLGRAELDPWETAGQEDAGPGTERWLTLHHRGSAEDTTAAKHTAGDKPLGELLVWWKGELVTLDDLHTEPDEERALALDEDGHAYEKVRHRESIAINLSTYRNCPAAHRDDGKVYAVVKLTAPPAGAGRVREGTTAPGAKKLEELTWHEQQVRLTFDDCGESAVDGFVVQLYHKSFFGADEYIGKVVVAAEDALWQAGDCNGEWLPVVPVSKKLVKLKGGELGELRLSWAFGMGEEKLVKKFADKTFDSILQAATQLELKNALSERRLPVCDRMRGEGYTLDVDVDSCEGLPKKGAAVVVATCGGYTERSDPSAPSDCPEWDNAEFHFPLACRNDVVTLVVTSGGQHVGKASLSPHDEFLLEGRQTLALYDDASSAVGTISVAFKYNHAVKGVMGFLPEYRGDTYPALPPRPRIQYSGILDRGSVVEFTVVQASNLPGVDGGSLTPKVVLEYHRVEVDVAAAERQSRYPVMNATRQVALEAKGGATAESIGPDGAALLKVYDQNAVLSDELVGVAPLDFINDYRDTLFVTSKEQIAGFRIAAEPPYVVTSAGGAAGAEAEAGGGARALTDLDVFMAQATQLLGPSGRRLTHIDGEPITSEAAFLKLQSEGVDEAAAGAELTFEKEAWVELRCREDEHGVLLAEDRKLRSRYGRLGRVLVRWAHNLRIDRAVVPEAAEDEGEPTVHVTVMEGESLIACDLISSDPYVLVRYGDELRKTEYKKSTLKPFWGEPLDPLPLADAETTLELMVNDFDTGNADDFMGFAAINPMAWIFSDADGAGAARAKEGWVDLGPRELNKDDEALFEKHNSSFGRLRLKVAVKGDLSGVKNAQVDLSREAALAREAQEVPPGKLRAEGGMVSVWVEEASGLARDNSAPTCVVKIMRKEFVTQPPGHCTASPAWFGGPYSARVPIHDPLSDDPALRDAQYIIDMEVMGGKDGARESLGYFAQDMEDLLHEVGTKTVALRQRDEEAAAARGLKSSGTLTFRWEIKFNAGDLAPWADPAVRRNLKEYLASHNLALQLRLKVLRCANLLDRDSFGKSDPYVVMTCGVNHSRTKVISSNLNPVFNHEVVWEIDTFEQPVEFSVMDKEVLGADQDLGVQRLQLANIADEVGEETLALQPSLAMTQSSDAALHSNLGYLSIAYTIKKIQRTSVRVRFTVVEAADLADPNTFFALKPRVVFAYDDGGAATEYSSQDGAGTSPVWTAAFDVALRTAAPTPVTVSVWDGTTCLGMYTRAFEFLGDDNEGDEWVALRPRAENEDDALLESKHGLGTVRLMWATDTDEARRERELKREHRLAQLYEASVLSVKVLRARHLPASMLLSPQCRLKFPPSCEDAAAIKSKKMSGTSPYWGLEASYKLSTVLLNQAIEITVVDTGAFSDTTLGTAVFNPWENATDTTGEKWLPLSLASDGGGGGKKKGGGQPEVFLSWSLTNDHARTQPVLQFWVDKVVDAVVPVGGGVRTASDTASVKVAVDFGPYHRTTAAVVAQKSQEQLGTQLATVALGEIMQFDPLPPTTVFKLGVFDVRSLESDVCLGTVEWDWGAEAEVEEGAKQLAIKPATAAHEALQEKVASLGTVAVRWGMVHRQVGGMREGQKVRVRVRKFRGLPPVDSPMRVYAVVAFGGARAISDPTQTMELEDWEAAFVAKNEGEVVRIEVWERNFGLASDTFLGYATLAYGEDEAADGEEWLRLQPRDGVEADFELAAQHDGMLGEVRVEWTWDAEVFDATGRRAARPQRYDLTVTVRNATNLTPADTNGLADPYIVLKAGDQEHKTEIVHNSLAPAFNQAFTFADVNVKHPLHLTCFDHDPGPDADDFMGCAKWVVPKSFAKTPQGVTTVTLGIRKGNKDDVKLQEKYQGHLGSVSFEWEIEEVEEGGAEAVAEAPQPVGVITVTVLTAKVHNPKKSVKIRATVGEVSRETIKQAGQDPSWDKLGVRDEWKFPELPDTAGVLLEMVDAKAGQVLAARLVTKAEFDEQHEHRQHIALNRVVEGRVLDGSPSGDMVDVYMHRLTLEEIDPARTQEAAAKLAGVLYCRVCKTTLSDGDAECCPKCGEGLVDLSYVQWRPEAPGEDGHAPLGPLCIGGAAPADQVTGSVGAAVARTSKNVYVFGGINKGGFNPRLRQYDIPLQRWATLEEAHPYQRYGATMVHYRQGLLIYGGYGPGGLDAGLTSIGGTIETDSHVIDVEPDGDYWADPSVALGDMDHHAPPQQQQQQTRAPQDSGGSSVTAAALGLPAKKAAAGATAHLPNGYFDSVLRYDISTKTWSKLKSYGPGWDFRASHCAVMYKGRMIVYGGWGIFVKQSVFDSSRRSARLKKAHLRYSTIECRRGDLSCYNVASGKWTWIKPAAAEGPPPRSHHTGVLKPGTAWLVVFGGATVENAKASRHGDLANADAREAAVEYLNDLWVFDLQQKVWTAVPPEGDVPAPRAEHAASVFEHYMFLFGGRNARQTFGEDQCYSFCFGNGVWTKVSRHHTISRTLGGGVTRNQRHKAKRYNEQQMAGAKTGRWGGAIVAFRPPMAKADPEAAEARSMAMKKRQTQKQRAEELLSMIGEAPPEQAALARRKKVDPQDVKLCILILGGCENDVVSAASPPPPPPPADEATPAAEDADEDAADQVIAQLTEEMHASQARRRSALQSDGAGGPAYVLRGSVVHPPRGSDARGGSVLANPRAPLAVQRSNRLRLPGLHGACAMATVWELVARTYSRKLAGGVENPRRPSVVELDRERPWGATGADTGKRFVRGAGGGPARMVTPATDLSTPQPRMKKMTEGDIGTVTERLAGQRGVYLHGRVDRVAMLKKKMEAESKPAAGARRPQASIDAAIEQMVEGRSASGRPGRQAGVVVLPKEGDAVRLAVPKCFDGISLLAYAAGTVKTPQRRLPKHQCLVAFPSLPDPVVVPVDDLLLKTAAAAGPVNFGVQRKVPARPSAGRRQPRASATAPPRHYVFPEQWLADDAAGDGGGDAASVEDYDEEW
eukprot:TRINITY_DN510_c2_g2_i2.p1 TRINITY_DN510_c2_g2~~TRINITY_DN510_c2_g2_i2.p1  ORF type:complete len:3375 (+),score=1213.80 TRINITY_DN510_c2_g2_i2:1055-11179(+)